MWIVGTELKGILYCVQFPRRVSNAGVRYGCCSLVVWSMDGTTIENYVGTLDGKRRVYICIYMGADYAAVVRGSK